jgi:hypothetical protein
LVQGALKLILETNFEADFQPGSFGYRPKGTAHDAIDRVAKAIVQQKTRVIDIDLRSSRGLEREWEDRLSALEAAKAELARCEAERPRVLLEAERASLLAIGADLDAMWNATCMPLHTAPELLSVNRTD